MREKDIIYFLNYSVISFLLLVKDKGKVEKMKKWGWK